MQHRIPFEDLLMVKFYVVDGLSYPACETAIGLFGHHGYEAMKNCRTLGYLDKNAKGSETLRSFRNALLLKQVYPTPPASPSDLATDALEYYLGHSGFGVKATETEVGMARAYLVERLTYPSAEKQFRVDNKRGFAAMYSVCKLGGFRGREERGSMTAEAFRERLRALGLV